MKLVYIEFDLRTYALDENNSVDKSNYKDYTIDLTFDKLDSVSIDNNLQVCTAETIRGKNKTFNAYLKPKTFKLVGKFNDKQSTNVLISEQSVNEETNEITSLMLINTLTGQEKSKKINDLFESLIEDTRLVTLKMFYGDYENYALTDFNLTYINNNTIDVELSFQEILIRDLNDYGGYDYKLTELLNELAYQKKQYIISKLSSIDFTDPYISISEVEEYLDTYSQGGHYE